MKTLITACLAISLAAVGGAQAQTYRAGGPGAAEPQAEGGAQVFARLPLGDVAPAERGWQFGLGAYAPTDCAQGTAFSREACGAEGRIGLEYRFAGPQTGAFMVGPGGEAPVAALNGASEYGSGQTWLWVGLGVVALAAVAAAASSDDSSGNCPEGQVATPLTGCAPIS